MFFDILHFLKPQNEFVQIFFATIMLSLWAITVIGVVATAKESNWDANWRRRSETAQDDVLTAEYGSSQELSNIVATRWEKLADVMPGILLILGLLGTFIGLGVALNKASDILQHSGDVSMDGTMGNLKAMVEGLGTKFKTSTWGIAAFLALKAFASAHGYEETRLRWSVRTLKAHADGVARQQAKEKSRVEDHIVTVLESVGERITRHLAQTDERRHAETAHVAALLERVAEALGTQTRQLVDTFRSATQGMAADVTAALKHHDERRNAEFEQHARMLTLLAETQRDATKEHAFLLMRLDDSSRATVAAVEATHAKLDAQTEQTIASAGQAREAREAIEQMARANIDNIERLGKAGSVMSHAATAMSGSAKELKVVIGELQTEFTGVLGEVKDGLSESISSMNANFDRNITKMSVELIKATDGISESVSALSESVDATLDKMGEQMDTATQGIRDSVTALSKSVEDTLGKMGKELASATKEINQSVGSLSKSVKTTLESVSHTVKTAIDDSKRLQANATVELTTLTGTLSENVGKSTEMIDSLGKPITMGLTGVAESNLKMNQILAEFSRMSGIPVPKTKPKSTSERPRRTSSFTATTERTRRTRAS